MVDVRGDVLRPPHDTTPEFIIETVLIIDQSSGGSRGGSGGSNELPLEPKLFHFHGEFQDKLVKLHKLNPPQLIWTPDPKILDPPLQALLTSKPKAASSSF